MVIIQIFLVSVIDPVLWPKVRRLISSTIFSWPMEPSLLPHLVHVPVWAVPFSWYALSPILYPEGNVNQVVDELICQMAEERWCWHGCRAGIGGGAGGMGWLLEDDVEQRVGRCEE